MKKYSKVLYAVPIFVVVTGGTLLWSGAGSFLFAWVLNLMLMMVTLAITQTFRPALTSDYYAPKIWESEGRIYKWIGIDAFRKLLVLIGWERHNKPSAPVKKTVEALHHLEYLSRQSELGHTVIFFIVSATACVVGYFYGPAKTLWLISLNILLNAYPVALQRYNRPRYSNALRKLVRS